MQNHDLSLVDSAVGPRKVAENRARQTCHDGREEGDLDLSDPCRFAPGAKPEDSAI